MDIFLLRHSIFTPTVFLSMFAFSVLTSSASAAEGKFESGSKLESELQSKLQPRLSVFSQFDIVATSEAVPIHDMANGWDGDYRRGELVFADAKWSTGFSVNSNVFGLNLGEVSIAREQRSYYYMSFDKETSDFYRALELDETLTGNKKLDLEVKQFDALGMKIGYQTPRYTFKEIDMRAGISFTYYDIGHFQFGRIQGIAEAGDVEAASAVIDYRYDNDKILDHQAEVDDGTGMSFSANMELTFQNWQAALALDDIFNRFQWDDGAFTTGCVNIGGGSNAQCQTDGAGSGISGQKTIIESIPTTLNSRLTHLGADVTLHLMRHDEFYRLGLEKGYQTSLGRFALFLYHPRLVGGSWQTKYFNFQLGADTLKLSRTRNIQLNMGVNWHW
jgi:hypothetical protein